MFCVIGLKIQDSEKSFSLKTLFEKWFKIYLGFLFYYILDG
jgi:hypothetical protein